MWIFFFEKDFIHKFVETSKITMLKGQLIISKRASSKLLLHPVYYTEYIIYILITIAYNTEKYPCISFFNVLYNFYN